ncbi:Ig-like domain-containing protein, partial [Myxococcus sp. AM010]|uniref:Ig-like domain-containing protein n=1 Tax=Myxococcus sp. AM010 TaxID=2745138 RepID=UPI001595DC2D
WVRAKDAAGNVDNAPPHHTWTVDLTPPDTELFGALPAAVNNASSVVLTFRELPTGSANAFECSLNGAAFAACESGDSFPTPGNTTYTFLVRAKDAAGNVDPTPASYSWRTDKTRPDTSMSTTVGTLSNASRAGFEFDSPASDVAGFQCVLENSTTTQAPVESSPLWQDCAASYLTPVLTDGAYTLWVRAKDAADNVDASPARHTWTVDLTPPDTELFGALPAAVNNANAAVLTFRALPVGDASDFECSLNGAAFSACGSGDSFPTPGDNTYTFLVRAKDPAGNVDPTPASHTWRTDKTRPETELSTSVGTLSNASRAGFDFDSPSSDVAGFQCVLDTPATTQAPPESSSRWQDCAASYLTPVLTDGAYTLWVRAKDAAGNVDNAPPHHTWTVDLTPPDTELFGALPAAVNNANAAVLTFRALPVGDASDFECSLNGAAFSACGSGDSFPTPGDNTYTFLVRAKDPAGNVDPTPASHTWRTDKTRPDTELSTLVGALSNAPRALFTLSSAATDVAGFQCVLETGGTTQAPAEGSSLWEDCAASFLTPVLTDGTYTLWVRAKDAAGNVDASPARHTWTVDLTPPDTQIDSKPDILTNLLTATFVFSASEPGVHFECSYDGGAYFACTSPYALPNAEFPLITEGEHRMLIRAIDEAGNPDDTPALHIWTVVVGEVETNIVPVALSNPTQSTTATFRFTSNLSNVIYLCQLDGSPYEQCADSANAEKVYENLTEGSHSLNVKAAEGEFEDQSPAPFNWTIDLTPPVAPTLSSPSVDVVYVNVRTPRFEGVAPDDESLTDGTLNVYRGVQLVDSVEDIRANALWAFDFPVSLPDGEYTLHFSFMDKAGNTGATTSRTFTVDATRPVTTLTVNPGDLTNQAQATFEFTSNETESTFACSLNGAGFSACTSPHTVSVGDASHEFVVRAVDRAGNVANVIGTHSWRVDTVEPSTRIAAKPDVDTNAPNAEFRFESNEAPILYECSLDDAAFVECATPYLLNDLPEGAHRLVVRARDEATNVDTTPEEHVWRVDMTPPLAPEITAPALDGVVGSLTPTFQGSAEPGSQLVLFVDGVERGVAPVEPSGQWRLTLTTAISEGPHTVSALARDAALNEGPQSQASAFSVDPSINIIREVSSRGGGLSCAAGGEGHVPLMFLGWASLVLMAARRRRV